MASETSDATINLILAAVGSLYDYQDRLGVETMAAAGTSRMADPTHELRELSQLQLSPIMLLFDQKGPVGL